MVPQGAAGAAPGVVLPVRPGEKHMKTSGLLTVLKCPPVLPDDLPAVALWCHDGALRGPY